MPSIPLSEVQFHPSSNVDPNGRLFWWHGGLHRGIARRRASFYRRLFDDGVIPGLIDKGLLVETHMSDLTVAEYELVLRHRVIPFASYAYEWCPQMLRDAALLLLDLQIALAQHGLTLQDAHPWNILLDGCRPTYVDFCSIVPADPTERWRAFNEFRHFFLNPLRLMTHGHVRIARWLLHDWEQGVRRQDVLALTQASRPNRASGAPLRTLLSATRYVGSSTLHRLRGARSTFRKLSTVTPTSPIDRLRAVHHDIERLTLPAGSAQCTVSTNGGDASSQGSDTYQIVHQALAGLRPSTVLDIAVNRGSYAEMAASLGSTVLAFDVDDGCVTGLYRRAKEGQLAILPLVMNCVNPSPGYGLCNLPFQPATARLACDMVMALDLLQHLVLRRRLTFERVAAALASFSKRWLLVEYHRDLRNVQHPISEAPSWYTLDNLIAALRRHFQTVDVYPADRDSRDMVLCTK